MMFNFVLHSKQLKGGGNDFFEGMLSGKLIRLDNNQYAAIQTANDCEVKK